MLVWLRGRAVSLLNRNDGTDLMRGRRACGLAAESGDVVAVVSVDREGSDRHGTIY